MTGEIGLLERPGQATQNLMLGDLPAGFQAMFQPGDLLPQERDAFLKKHGLDKSVWAPVFRLMTNPLLIVSLAAGFKFPVASAKNMFKVKNAVAGMTKRFPILGRLSSMQGLYRGTKVADDYTDVVTNIHLYRTEFNEKMSGLLRTFRSQAGKTPSSQEQMMISSWLDGLHRPLRGWEGTNGVLTMGKGATRVNVPSVGTLMPDLEAHMGRPLLQLAKGTREVFDDMWTKTFGSPKNRESIRRAMGRMKGGQDELTDVWREYLQNPRKIEHYYPHRLMTTEADFLAMFKNMTSEKQAVGAAARKTVRWVGPESHTRRSALMPSLVELDDLSRLKPGVVDKAQLERLKEVAKYRIVADAGGQGKLTVRSMQKLKESSYENIVSDWRGLMSEQEAISFRGSMEAAQPKQYSLKLMDTFNSYSQSMGSTFGWTVMGGGEKLQQHVRTLKGLGASGVEGAPYAKMRAEMLENTYIPLALGRGTFKNALKSQAWEQNMYKLASWVRTPKVRGVLGEDLAKTMHGHLTNARSAFSYVNLSQKAAGYFYLSTLGLNPASALKNVLQLVLTTGPTLGYKTTAMGLSAAMKKSHKYFASRFGAQKLSHEEAIRSAYPAFGKSGAAAAPITDEVMENSLKNIAGIQSLAPGKLVSTQKKISSAMMSLFTATETTNRLATWEGALIHAKRSKMPTEMAHKFATKVVAETQFLTGPQNTPYLLAGVNPLVRQLGQFPLRFLEFATHTAWNLGSAESSLILGKNPGTFARMIAGSIIALEAGREVGVDAGDALLTGAIPSFQKSREGDPFGGFPIVPPALQLGGAVATGLATQDFSALVRATPLAVPGGIAAMRVAGIMPADVVGETVAETGVQLSRFVGRGYADYQNPSPDGRIPVYTPQRTLKGFYTRWEILAQGLGIRQGDKVREENLMRTIIKGREQIQESRKDYLDARLRNDATDARSVAERFQIQFGFPLPVTEQDIEGMQLRRRVSRLERLVRTLPPGPARDQYVQLIASSLGSSGPALLGIDPALLGEPKPAREAARGNVSTQRSAPQSYRTGPFDSVDPARVGRQHLPDNSSFGF